MFRHPCARERRALLLAALLVVGALSSARAYAQATTVSTNETIPFTSTIVNPCNSDAVTFSGNLHITNHVTTDSSGGTHVKTHINYQGASGTGAPSGATYRVMTTSNTTDNDSDTPQNEVTVVQVINLIGQGNVPNFRLFMTFHVTINANGQTTSVHEGTTARCSGGPLP